MPANVILKFLKEHPAVAGVAVPGMPSGSPGMEGGSKQVVVGVAQLTARRGAALGWRQVTGKRPPH